MITAIAVAGPRRTAWHGWLAVALLVAACGKGSDAAKGPRDAVLDAWKAEKLAPAAALAPATVAFGKDCQSGTIESIDVLLCNFATPADARAAEDPALGWVGQATGMAQARGSALIVLADRKKSDPSGRLINKLMKLAPK